MIVITHDPADLELLADHLVVFDHGQVRRSLSLLDHRPADRVQSRTERVARVLADLFAGNAVG
jgi:hypothetical protein